jgi:hypothetical protein
LGHIARTAERKNAYTILAGKTEGKRPLGRQRSRWEDNIGMDVRNIVTERVYWIYGSGWGPVVGPCEHGNETSKFHYRWGTFDYLSDC